MDTGGADAPPAGDLVSAHDGDQWVTWGGDDVSISSDSNQAGFEESSVTLCYFSITFQLDCKCTAWNTFTAAVRTHMEAGDLVLAVHSCSYLLDYHGGLKAWAIRAVGLDWSCPGSGENSLCSKQLSCMLIVWPLMVMSPVKELIFFLWIRADNNSSLVLCNGSEYLNGNWVTVWCSG